MGLEPTTLGLRVPCSTDWASRAWKVILPGQFSCPGGSHHQHYSWTIWGGVVVQVVVNRNKNWPRTKFCTPRNSAPSTHSQNYIALYVAFTFMVVLFEGGLYSRWSLSGRWGYNRKDPIWTPKGCSWHSVLIFSVLPPAQISGLTSLRPRRRCCVLNSNVLYNVR